MRLRFARHLQAVLRIDPTAPARPRAGRPPISPELTGHQYAIFLLRVAAGIEHALMAQYLYAAYSLGGPGVAPRHAAAVARWQETILGIAKEEMGHLITVQNVLRLISGPISFDREDYPYDAAFYPFDFTLERLSRPSLAKYVYAEQPAGWRGPLADEITRLATRANHDATPNAVGELYALMIETLADRALVPDDVFRPETGDQQAPWSEWGRGYARGARGNALGGQPPGSPELIIRTLASRAQAVAALREIAEQGEATTLADGERSHFLRFLAIYDEWRRLEGELDFAPARPVATNPIVEDSIASPASPAPPATGRARTVITHPVTFYWGHLLNLRYRLLLGALTHLFQLSAACPAEARPAARGVLIGLVFGEMYKLRAISSLLVELPVCAGVPVTREAAGPPFEMPYTLLIPAGEPERWRWHRDTLVAARGLLGHLAPHDPRFVAALRDGDAELIHRIDLILAGLEPRGRGAPA